MIYLILATLLALSALIYPVAKYFKNRSERESRYIIVVHFWLTYSEGFSVTYSKAHTYADAEIEAIELRKQRMHEYHNAAYTIVHTARGWK